MFKQLFRAMLISMFLLFGVLSVNSFIVGCGTDVKYRKK